MKNAINKIMFTDDFTGERFQINLDGKNLIITGDNGSGKTKFLERINSVLNNSLDSPNTQLLEIDLQHSKTMLSRYNPDSAEYNNINSQIIELEKKIISLKPLEVEVVNLGLFKDEVKSKVYFINFFNAHRQANISIDGRITSRESLLAEYKNSLNSYAAFEPGVFFERYIITIWNYSLLKKASGDMDDYERVFEIIENIEKDLRELFEDETLKLDFNLEELKIYIRQKDKNPFCLNQLSSGFSSVLAIYTHLIMKCEFDKLSKDSIKGIAIIDEIDAHLHVTLQKRVFSFFSNSFPSIQFIISTHSPFVIQSVDNSIIYNLSSHEQMEDLSLYSYTSIIKGLLGETSESDALKGKIKTLESLYNNETIDIVALQRVVNGLEPFLEKMDAASKIKVALAQNKIIELLEGE
ncbi:ATP-binding protein [Citrobacter freundii]|uniref:AAA family ATPase n=1 Tax=Citrobacter freundii TaxID=546 RepID=UPI0015EA3017|nr:AAA family ATPase [Citrobacter freundii]QLY61724.1 ATP-binding protein [Citrobacter freundii]